MKILNMVAKKMAKTASETAVETVKVEAAKATKSLLPILGGVALGVVVGVFIFKVSSAKTVANAASSAIPMIARTTVTNNYIFDKVSQKLLVDSILKQ